MVHMSKETKQSPQEVLDKAVTFFGPPNLGLALQQRNDQSVAFQGGGGYITVTACRTAQGDRTEVDIESREWDDAAQRFLYEI